MADVVVVVLVARSAFPAGPQPSPAQPSRPSLSPQSAPAPAAPQAEDDQRCGSPSAQSRSRNGSGHVCSLRAGGEEREEGALGARRRGGGGGSLTSRHHYYYYLQRESRWSGCPVFFELAVFGPRCWCCWSVGLGGSNLHPVPLATTAEDTWTLLLPPTAGLVLRGLWDASELVSLWLSLLAHWKTTENRMELQENFL